MCISDGAYEDDDQCHAPDHDRIHLHRRAFRLSQQTGVKARPRIIHRPATDGAYAGRRMAKACAGATGGEGRP